MKQKKIPRAKVGEDVKQPSLFSSPHAEIVETLYRQQNYKGRPPKDSLVMLCKLVKDGQSHNIPGFPKKEEFLNTPPWATALIDGGTAYREYLEDMRSENLVTAWAESAQSPDTEEYRSAAGEASGARRREKAIQEMQPIATAYQSAHQITGKSDAHAIAKWFVQENHPGMAKVDQNKIIRSLTKRLRNCELAI